MLDIIKNPIVIALFAGTLTYIYMAWSIENKNKKQKDALPKSVNLVVPLVVTVIVWILAYGYFNIDGNSLFDEPVVADLNNGVPITNAVPIANAMPTYKLTQAGGNAGNVGNINHAISASESPVSYQLINKGLTIPNNLKLPDVFIETLN